MNADQVMFFDPRFIRAHPRLLLAWLLPSRRGGRQRHVAVLSEVTVIRLTRRAEDDVPDAIGGTPYSDVRLAVAVVISRHSDVATQSPVVGS